MVEIMHKSQTPQMFDRIAFRYDLLNTVLSGGMHKAWRDKLSKRLPHGENLHVLDLATGTGDQLVSLFKTEKVGSAIGLDPSVEMVTIGERKMAKRFPEADVTFVEADAAKIPFQDNAFDAVTMSFGIRNVPEAMTVLKEAYRVLKHRGRFLVLEFSLPKNPLMQWLYKLYLRTYIPFVGFLFSGDWQAYRYLDKSIETFPAPDRFEALLREAGFSSVSTTPLLFGAVRIYNAMRD